LTPLVKEPQLVLPDGKVIVHGELFKVSGEYGLRFKFESLTRNEKTGSEWVDCFEVFRGRAGAFRSFRSDRIKRIPKRRLKKVKKNVI
jgi:hypothetical protein